MATTLTAFIGTALASQGIPPGPYLVALWIGIKVSLYLIALVLILRFPPLRAMLMRYIPKAWQQRVSQLLARKEPTLSP